MPTEAVAIGHDPSVLGRLADPRVRLAIWLRRNPRQEGGFPEYALVQSSEIACLPDWLATDIRMLGAAFETLCDGSWTARMETARGRTCPGFHEDAVRLRLLVTYRGPGTEWAHDPDLGPIDRIPTGAVAVFKGRGWPSFTRILHRSAKASTARPRWVLAIDAAAPEEGRATPLASPSVSSQAMTRPLVIA